MEKDRRDKNKEIKDFRLEIGKDICFLEFGT
jgi:hypothetical protein